MPTRPPSKSYDEIVRGTVIEPDGSWRPSAEQEAEGLARTGPGYPEEDALRRTVVDRLATSRITGVSIEVHRDRVTLEGTVGDPAAIGLIQAIVEAIPGVGTVENRLVVG
ncbi:MAG TPA: BON domain-containing protein [Kofleriaceae bacterium]